MNKPVVTKHQPSMTEWFEAIGGVTDSNAFRDEDNKKAQRLETLYQTIDLAYERPEKFTARDLADKTPAFQKVLDERGDNLCAIRLVPKKEGLPKLRDRGQSIRECYENWFLKQDINPDDYIAYLCPHSGTLLWSAIFVVDEDAIFGEVIRGLHSQLTHGDTENKLYQFLYDFKEWQWSEEEPEMMAEVKKMVASLLIEEEAKRDKLKKELQANFSHDYLAGYFETTVWPDNNIYFIDYNRILPKYIANPVSLSIKTDDGEGLRGISVCPGVAKGRVVKVDPANITQADFSEGDVLVCQNTDVRYLPLMRKAGAIVTELGGVLSHAAIVARELNKPCVIGVKEVMETLEDGDKVEVDASNGVVKKVN